MPLTEILWYGTEMLGPQINKVSLTCQNYNLLKLGKRNLKVEKSWTLIHLK